MTTSWSPASALPYGAVMATGAAARLAPAAGLSAVAPPLLTVTIVQALVIAVRALTRHANPPHGSAMLPRAQQFGLFTVPIGCTVIGINLTHYGPVAVLDVAAGAIVVGGLATVWLLLRVAAPVARHWPPLAAVNGTWFLGPAALLVDALGAVALQPHATGGAQPVLRWLALITCALGTVGYGLVVALSAVRIRRHGLAGAPRAPWCIGAGCGGLAAAALGQVAALAQNPAVAGGFDGAALVAWVLACGLAAPVLVGGARHLYRVRRPYGPIVWPPTFSTGVYALGTGQVAALIRWPTIEVVYRVSAVATVAAWLITALLLLTRLRNSPVASSG